MRCGQGSLAFKILGGLLMATGVVLVLISLPCWIWAALLGLLLLGIGFLLFRFG